MAVPILTGILFWLAPWVAGVRRHVETCDLEIELELNVSTPVIVPCYDPSSDTFRMPRPPTDVDGVLPSTAVREAMTAAAVASAAEGVKVFAKTDKAKKLATNVVSLAMKAGLTKGTMELAKTLMGPLGCIWKGGSAAYKAYKGAGAADAKRTAEAKKEESLQNRFQSVVKSLGQMGKAQRVQEIARQVEQDYDQLLKMLNEVMQRHDDVGDDAHLYADLNGLHSFMQLHRAHWIVPPSAGGERDGKRDGERCFILLSLAVEMANVHMAIMSGILAVTDTAHGGKWLEYYIGAASSYAKDLREMVVAAVDWRCGQYASFDGELYWEFCPANEQCQGGEGFLVSGHHVLRRVRLCIMRDTYICTSEKDGFPFVERLSPCEGYKSNAWVSQTLSHNPADCNQKGLSMTQSLDIKKSLRKDTQKDLELHKGEDATDELELHEGKDPQEDLKLHESTAYDRKCVSEEARGPVSVDGEPVFHKPQDVTVEVFEIMKDTAMERVKAQLYNAIFDSIGASLIALLQVVGCDKDYDENSIKRMLFLDGEISRCLKNRYEQSVVHIIGAALEANSDADVVVRCGNSEETVIVPEDTKKFVAFPLMQQLDGHEIRIEIEVRTGDVTVKKLVVDELTLMEFSNPRLHEPGKYDFNLQLPESLSELPGSWFDASLGMTDSDAFEGRHVDNAYPIQH